MAKNGQDVCGICGKRWKESLPKLTPYGVPVPAGDCYVTRRELLCEECKLFVQNQTKKKIIELGYEIEERRKQFRKVKYE